MIRLAIIGLGAVTRNIHLPAYAQLKNKIRVVAGCDPDAGARAWALSKEKAPAVYEQAAEMIERQRPDVIAVCTPPSLHYAQTIAALEAGCHVFLEKPMAENLAQADDIIRASERTRRLVVVNTQFPCMRIYRAAKAMIGSPEFGRLLFLHARQKMRANDRPEAGWRGEMERRLCFEFGVHVFELVRFFFDDTPVKITAHMPRARAAIKSDTVNIITMEFADGRAASVVLDRLSKGPDRYLELDLDGEFASIHTSIGGEARCEIGMETRSKTPFFKFHFVQGGKAIWQNGTRSKLIAKDGVNPFASATAWRFDRFLEAIDNGREPGSAPPGSAADNRKTLALALAAYDSAESGQTVELSPYLKPGVMKAGGVSDEGGGG
jgi:predicted dehydrogenase